MGEVVNIGQVEELEVQNKPAKKIEFVLRDEKYVYLLYIYLLNHIYFDLNYVLYFIQ